MKLVPYFLGVLAIILVMTNGAARRWLSGLLRSGGSYTEKGDHAMDENLNDFLIGKWKGESRETEWGDATMEITFSKDTFRFETYFDKSETPLVMKGAWKLVGSALIAESWNKGDPINVSKEGDKLVLQTGDDPPVTLTRAK